MTVALTEEFADSLGQWHNYDNYQAADRATIAAQKHVDIRSFYGAQTAAQTMYQMSTQSVSALGAFTMAQLASAAILPAEPWTGGDASVDRWATRANFTLLAATLALGANTFTSTMVDLPVDLLTGFDDTDHFSVALPSFPLGNVNTAASYIDITSEPTGNFTTGPTASVALSASTVALVSGHSEFRVNRSAFNQNGIDLSNITAIRFRIQATSASATNAFKVMAIRLLATTWTQTALDFDTRTGRLRKCPARNGDHTTLGSAWPIMWRASEPSGQDDPRPIDAEMGVVFSPGYVTDGGSLTLYFREVTEDFLTQLDLRYLRQAELNGHDQPDIGSAMYNPRTQTDLEFFSQSELADQQQVSLERTPDYLSASWIQFVCQWSSSGGNVTIVDTEGNGYTFNFSGPLTNYASYVLFATLDENSARATIYSIDASGHVGSKFFDSSTIIDDTSYKRRKGRFGWHSDLRDGNSWIDSIRTRKVSYAEYRSLPYDSTTPVVGAELFATASPVIELFESFAPSSTNSASSIVDRDSQRSLSGSSWRFVNDGSIPMQGFQSNSFLVQDFDNSVIEFDLFTPSTYDISLSAYLLDMNGVRVIDLLMPPLIRDQWQSIKIGLPFDQNEITGRYRLLLLQDNAATATWWVDSPSIYRRTVAWEGRAVVDDPWKSNDARWTPFKEAMNDNSGGVLFPRRGSQLQIRARGLTQDAHIDRIQFKPKYAELGRIKPSYTAPYYTTTVSFGSSSTGTNAVRLTGSFATVLPSVNYAYPANFEWNFGDGGIGIGPVVDHTYAASGVYTVTLVVTDNNGKRWTYSNTVAV